MPLIEPGQRAPAFSLLDQAGALVRLSQFRGRTVVVYFYPEDDTDACTREACAFSELMPEFSGLEVVVLGISPDTPESHAAFVRKHRLGFSLLSDNKHGPHGPRVCVRYGVWREKVLYGRRYVGLVRTTYLIDRSGRVARRWDHVRVKGHAERVLETIRAL